MQSLEKFKKDNGELPKNVIRMKETDILSKLIEQSVSRNSSIIVTDKNDNDLGIITQKELLKSAVEGQDE